MWRMTVAIYSILKKKKNTKQNSQPTKEKKNTKQKTVVKQKLCGETL